MKLDRNLGVINLNITLYAFCFWLCQPMLPNLTKQLGADPITFGYLQTTFSLVQLIGGPLVGRIVDIRGARFALIASQIAGGLAYLLLGVSVHAGLVMLFVSRLPTLIQHSMQAAQAAVTDLTTQETRAASLGRLGLFYGIGYVAGPVLGGSMSSYIGPDGVAALAALLSFVSVPFTLSLLPDTRSVALKQHAASSNDSATPASSFSLSEFRRVLASAGLRNFLLLKLFLGLSFSIFQSNFSLVADKEFHLDTQQIGFVLSASAAVGIVVQAIGISVLQRFLSDANLLRGSAIVMCCGFTSLAFAHSTTSLLCSVFPVIAAGVLIRVLAQALLTSTVDLKDTGTAIGLDHGIGSLCGVISPLTGAFIYSNFTYPAVAATCASLAFVALMHAHFNIRLSPKKTKAD